MPADSTTGRRAIPPLEPPPSNPDPGVLLEYCKRIYHWSQFVLADVSGVPGGFKDSDPNPTGTVSDAGTEDAGWMAADATIKQGIVTTKGDILTHNATVPAALPVGSNSTVLLADSSQATGQRWASQSELSGAGGGFARHLMFQRSIEPVWPLRAPNGSATTPSYSFYANTTAGLWYDSANTAVKLKGKDGSGTDAAGQRVFITGGQGTGTGNGGSMFLQVAPPSDSSSSSLNALQTGLSISGINGAWNIGGINMESGATSSNLDGANAAAGQTNENGASISIRAGRGTGTGVGGDLIFQVTPPSGSSGTTQNTRQTAASVSGTNGAIGLGGLDVVGTPGSSAWAGANRASGVTDGSGGAVVISGGRGTGTGADGTVKVQLAPAATSTATTQNSLRDVELWDVGSLADPQTTDVTLTGNNGGTMVRKAFSELLTLSTSGTTTDTSADLLPAGSIILAVNTRVTTTISGGGVAAFSVGDPTTAARFSASAAGLSSGSTRIGLQHQQGSVTTDAAGPVQTSAAKVRITTDATPSAGVVRIQVWALVFSAPTS